MNLFRLAGLQRLRKVQEDEAAATLARSAVAHRREQERARRALDGLAGSELADETVLAWRASVASRAAHSAALVAAEAGVRRAADDERAATAAWSAARQRSKTLEKLADKHAEAEALDDARTEQRVLDELAGRRPPATQDAP